MSVTTPIRRSSLKREYDREQWSSSKTRTYTPTVLGEAGEFLTREVFFGRAYEGPPFLNWDASLFGDWLVWDTFHVVMLDWIALTVGVANWIIDDNGAYIGARLWIVIPCVPSCGE